MLVSLVSICKAITTELGSVLKTVLKLAAIFSKLIYLRHSWGGGGG